MPPADSRAAASHAARRGLRGWRIKDVQERAVVHFEPEPQDAPAKAFLARLERR
jgi:hypothetical protein